MVTFSRHTQGKWIAGAYKAVGLYSIPLLTVVTIISMTNVFTAGQFAKWPFISTAWAFIFSLAIDVNIVRLFVEAKLDKSRGAFWLGLGLCIITGAALFMEGIEQAVGLQWSSDFVQTSLSILIAVRVILVVVLMAREGAKLGDMLLKMLAEMQAKSEQKQPETTPVVEEKPAQVEPQKEPIYYENFGGFQPELVPPFQFDLTPVFSEFVTQKIAIVEAKPETKQAVIEAPTSTTLEAVNPPLKQARNHQTRYSPEEAIKLLICQKNNIKVKAIKDAIKDGKLTANLNGKVSETAIKNWLKSREEVAS